MLSITPVNLVQQEELAEPISGISYAAAKLIANRGRKDNECHVRQPKQEQHMTIDEDSDNVNFVPPVLPALAVPAIIHERADFAVYTSFTGEEALHVYDVTVIEASTYINPSHGGLGM